MRKVDLLQSQTPIESSELILNPNGSIYHLALRPEQIADTIILVGDQNRVARISQHFESIEVKISNREFITHTGTFNNQRITAMSTGIGTDNIDIVINELDALVNIDLEARKVKKEHRALNLIRLGTSGSLQEDIPVDSILASTYGLGMDGVLGYYEDQFEADEQALKQAFLEQTGWKAQMNSPYFARGSQALLDRISEGMYQGITATANGFYGPQGRVLRLKAQLPDLNEQLNAFNYEGMRVTNFEMETSALYGLGGMLGHNCATVCAIIANRFRREYSKDYKQTVDQLIRTLLDRLTA